jgi:hypothetical protein
MSVIFGHQFERSTIDIVELATLAVDFAGTALRVPGGFGCLAELTPDLPEPFIPVVHPITGGPRSTAERIS